VQERLFEEIVEAPVEIVTEPYTPPAPVAGQMPAPQNAGVTPALQEGEEVCLAQVKVEVPDEIKQAAEEIVLSAETVGKNTALRSVGVVQRLLYARWCGHNKIGAIAKFAGISRSMLNRYLENGESAVHPCYVLFRSAWDQFFQGTVTSVLHNFRKSATAAGNWKAADAFLKVSDPESFGRESLAGQPAGAGTEIHVGNLQINVREKSADELMGLAAELLTRLSEPARQRLLERLPEGERARLANVCNGS
jgi:hypothetical protein